MTTQSTDGQGACPDEWPYIPDELTGWTDFNLSQERDYLTARAALGFADWWDRQAVVNVRAELEARANATQYPT